jgi:hypothetical protein
MEHELKITMTFDTEDGKDSSIKSSSIRVSVDDRIIGCMQELKLTANCKEAFPQLEITFPDLNSIEFDENVYGRSKLHFARDIDDHIQDLKLASNIKVKIERIDDGTSDEVVMDEIGTIGHIDSFPIKRANKPTGNV